MNPTQQSLEQTVAPGTRPVHRLGAFRYSAVKLLVALGLLFISAPFVEDLPDGNLIEAVLLTLVMVSAVLAVGGRRRTLIVALLLFTPAIVGKWIDHLYPGLISPVFFLSATTLFFGFVLAHLLRFILHAPRVDANVLCGGVAGFLTLGLLWIPLYVMVGGLNPAAFTLPASSGPRAIMDGFNAFYFSLITLCTVGYGDVVPVSRVARMLAVTEAISGLFYMTIFISRLVSVYSATQAAIHAKSEKEA